MKALSNSMRGKLKKQMATRRLELAAPVRGGQGARSSGAGAEREDGMTTTIQKFRKGDRVETTGKGRTAGWGKPFYGRVLRVNAHHVYVLWDGTHVDDQMGRSEIKLFVGDVAHGYYGTARDDDGLDVQVYVPTDREEVGE